MPRQGWEESDLTHALIRMGKVGGSEIAPGLRVGRMSSALSSTGSGIKTNSERRRVPGVETGPPTHGGYRSKWEAAYANKLHLESVAGIVRFYSYEPFSLWLPGKVRYKPDFLVQYETDGQLELIEVKGWSKNRRDGITRLKIAAALFPCFVWRMVYRTKGGGWDGEYL